jgi:hypothetical protein
MRFANFVDKCSEFFMSSLSGRWCGNVESSVSKGSVPEYFDEADVLVPRWHSGFELAPENAISAHLLRATDAVVDSCATVSPSDQATLTESTHLSGFCL